jgi:surface polysaccharide O-acyltransferase-like enzyme
MQEDRDLSFDAFRGIAIIAVVALHTIYLGGYWGARFLFYCQMFDFGVPAFIFISGYWLSKKPIESLKDYITFLMRRLPRVLVPYLFWSSLLLAYDAVKTGNVNPQEIIFKLLMGRAIFPYFFIILIAQFYVITPLLQHINRKPYGLILVIVINFISLLLRYLSRLHFYFWFPSVSLFYSWIIFYEIGLLTGGSNIKIPTEKRMLFFILPALLVFLVISGLEANFLFSRYNNLGFATHALKYSTLMYSLCIIFGFLFSRERFCRWPKLLVITGRYSFGLYLIHVPVLNCVVGVLSKTKVYSLPVLYQIIVGLVTISLCLVLIYIIRKLLPESFCRNLLGF